MEQLLEGMIDSHGLAAVLETLGAVCDEKADHIEQSYSDLWLARAWRRAAAKMRGVSRCEDVSAVTP